MSSVKVTVSTFLYVGISAVYNVYSKGRSTLPCGTPAAIGLVEDDTSPYSLVEDDTSPYRTENLLSSRYE